ncbi:ABC transporter substrate-binding protein, partial [Leucobacter sp. OLES1]
MRTRRLLSIAAALVAAVSISACSSAAPSGSGDAGGAGAGDDASGAFPVTIEHAFGKTTIERQPERIATVGWTSQEVPLALGIAPVGMAKITWGDDNGNGMMPWVEDKLAELKAPTPKLYDETDGVDFEAVAATKPDVILAAYSGITKEDYRTLSKIAPVVAYPHTAWGTSLDDLVRMDSEAIGKKAEGDALLKRLHEESAASLAKHPRLAKAKVLIANIDPKNLSQITIYTSHDTRPRFLEELGLPEPAIVTEESKQTDAFFATVSSEAADRFSDVDLIVSAGTPDLLKRMQADPLLSKIPAVAKGRVAILPDASPLAVSA